MASEIIGEDITPEDSIVPVYLVPLTPEEEAQREAEHKTWKQEEKQRELEAEQKEQSRLSALAKLESLGLTEDELKALIG
jgi:hypothetical protein